MDLKGIKKEVSKEELENYPLSKFEGKIIVIDRPEDVDQHLSRIFKSKVIGIDTETKPSFKRGVTHQVSLIQIATHEKVYLFRIHKTGFSFGLQQILSSENIIKVGIAFKDDIRDLNKIAKFEAKQVLDLNDIAKRLGYESIGAKKLSALLLGFRISKRQQTSNWESSNLSQPQVEYAATDAWICLEIYHKMIGIFPAEKFY